MVVKSIFIKGKTDSAGRLSFAVDRAEADIGHNEWKVKAQKIIIRHRNPPPPPQFPPPSQRRRTVGAEPFPPTPLASRVVSCSANFCSPLQSHKTRVTNPYTKVESYEYVVKRQPLKLALAIIPVSGIDDEYLELTSKSEEYVSFRHPPAQLELTLRDEESELPLPDTHVMAHLLIARDV